MIADWIMDCTYMYCVPQWKLVHSAEHAHVVFHYVHYMYMYMVSNGVSVYIFVHVQFVAHVDHVCTT